MSDSQFKSYMALFLSSLTAFLTVMFVGNAIVDWIPVEPVMTAIDAPFKICEGSKTVKPGGLVCYNIYYYKRLDIPGDLTKQLIVKTADGCDEMYIPLSDVSGHLPMGEVKKKACVQLPDWIPEGIGVIKLSSVHYVKSRRVYHTAFTQEFVIKNP